MADTGTTVPAEVAVRWECGRRSGAVASHGGRHGSLVV